MSNYQVIRMTLSGRIAWFIFAVALIAIVSMPWWATQSDVLFVTLAATPQTRHIVNADVLQALGPDGLLISISRAQSIDERALLDALEQGRLRGAALDVFEGEPALDPRFARQSNVLLPPHHASGIFETRRAMGQLLRENFAAHFAGRPLLTQVNA